MDFLKDGYYSLIVCPRRRGNPRNTADSLLELHDGTLVYIYGRQRARADEAASDVAAKKSTDGGFSWSASFVLMANQGNMNSGTGGWRRLHSGKIGVVIFHMDDYDNLKCYFSTTDDRLKEYSEPSLITARPGYNCPCNGRLLQLDSGRLIYPVAYTVRSRAQNENYSVLVYFSDDEGKTWRESRSELKLAKRGAMEPVVAEIKEGRCMMLIRTQLGSQYQSFSDDGGETWTPAQPSALISPEGGVYLTRIPSTGDLLACWNYDFKPHWHNRHYGLRCPLSAAISKNAGKTWENVKDIEDDHRYSFGNPSITFVKDKVYIVYYQGYGIDERGVWDAKLTILPESFFYDEKPLNRALREIPEPKTPLFV